MKLLYGEQGTFYEKQVDKVLAELDFVQTVNDLVSTKSELNPSMNAVAEAFKRRQLLGAFVTDDHEINLDALLHRDSVGLNDSDLSAPDVKKAHDRNRSRKNNLQRPDERGIC